MTEGENTAACTVPLSTDILLSHVGSAFATVELPHRRLLSLRLADNDMSVGFCSFLVIYLSFST